jgi:hypothetical protein
MATNLMNTPFNRSSDMFPGGYEPFNIGLGYMRDDGVTRINLLALRTRFTLQTNPFYFRSARPAEGNGD